MARAAPRRPDRTDLNLTKEGLVIGAGTVLAPRAGDRGGRSALTIDGNEERILALLAVAYRAAVTPGVIDHIRRAAAADADGETALALIHLSRAWLPRLAAPKIAAHRLYIGEALLEDGLSPRDFLKACDLDPLVLDRLATDYHPDEPRIPAGNGIESGEWTTDLAPGATATAGTERSEDYGTGVTPVADR